MTISRDERSQPAASGPGAVQARERAFWDRAAGASADTATAPPAPDPYADAMLARLEALGGIDGARVLDAGCGTGDLTLRLLQRGAHVTALDLSPASVELTRRRVAALVPGAPLQTVVAPLEATGLATGAFERVAGKWVLHHTDVARTGPELARVLQPGGWGVFFENQASNPVLTLARRHVAGRFGTHQVGTTDEHPLDRRDWEALGRAFATVERTYPSFYCFEALSRALDHRAHRALRGLDRAVWRALPPARRLSYHVLVSVRAAPPDSAAAAQTPPAAG